MVSLHCHIASKSLKSGCKWFRQIEPMEIDMCNFSNVLRTTCEWKTNAFCICHAFIQFQLGFFFFSISTRRQCWCFICVRMFGGLFFSACHHRYCYQLSATELISNAINMYKSSKRSNKLRVLTHYQWWTLKLIIIKAFLRTLDDGMVSKCESNHWKKTRWAMEYSIHSFFVLFLHAIDNRTINKWMNGRMKKKSNNRHTPSYRHQKIVHRHTCKFVHIWM